MVARPGRAMQSEEYSRDQKRHRGFLKGERVNQAMGLYLAQVKDSRCGSV